MAAISLTICNLALGDVFAPPIADPNEQSKEAQLCQRYYPHALARTMGDYPWNFAKRVQSLALLASNERSVEWAYAYSLPSDCAFAIRLLPTGAYIPLTTWALGYSPLPPPPDAYAFKVENGVLYTNVQDAVLEYTVYSVDESVMPPLFREAVRRMLAADLAIPLRDSPNLAAAFKQMAEAARQDAIASDMNRQPNREPVDDVAWARR